MKASVFFSILCVFAAAASFGGTFFAGRASSPEAAARESLLPSLTAPGPSGDAPSLVAPGPSGDVPYYADYLKNSGGFAGETIVIDAEGALSGSDSAMAYSFAAPKTGLYNIRLSYKPQGGSTAEIQRAVLIDGRLPYRELDAVSLGRVFAFDGGWGKDNRGNDLKPRSYEQPAWRDVFLYDDEGYYNAPLAVYLTAGEHEVAIMPLREEMLLGGITFTAAPAAEPYRENADARDTAGQRIIIEAESAARVSAQTLCPVADASSPAVSPSSPELLLNNSIGALLENGASPRFALTYSPASDLKNTGLNRFYAAYSKNWIGEASELYAEVNSILSQVSGAFVASHEIMGELRVLSYDNGKTLVINKGGESAEYNAFIIPPKSGVIL